MRRPFKIGGVGEYLPANRVLSSELEKELSLPEGWIMKYTGVASRPIAIDETNRSMAVGAIEEALRDARLTLSDVAYLISASATYDSPLPNNASRIKAELMGSEGLDFPCVDIDITCLSFMAALDYASSLVSADCKHIIVVSSEIASRGLNPENLETYTLFGDAAAAVIVSYDASGESGAIKYELKTYTEGVDFTSIKGGGNDFPVSQVPYDPALHTFQMQGRQLLKSASKRLPVFLHSFFTEHNASEVDWVIPHQASKAGLSLFQKTGMFPEDKLINVLADMGNCIAASIPCGLVRAIKESKLKRGDTCLLIGTSAGFSIGAMLLKY
ncbi:MAG: beta-ketoacyl-ACP synthase III [Roseivirga sp.]